MNLLTIIQDFDRKLQEYDNTPLPFREFIVTLLAEYNSVVQSTTDLFFGIDRYNTDEETLKERINIVVNGTIKSLNHYLQKSTVDGEAMGFLKSCIDDSNLFQFTKKLKTYENNSSFYRLRKAAPSATILPREQLFHIGFGTRGRASSQRFSVPGFPCLYLSNAIYAAWKEMGEEVHTQGVRIENNRRISLFDFSNTPFTPTEYNSQELPDELIVYSMFFPLIAACTLKVKNKDYSFKDEYIIPQLLLEYIRTTPNVEGIMYKSTKISIDIDKTKFINIIIPPKTKPHPDKGYCDKLKVIFSMTDVEKITFDPSNLILPSKIVYKNPEIERVEISGSLYTYDETLFAKIEHDLKIKAVMSCSSFVEV